ncbi:vWA domain-containing protein [uncultured Nostoc sp.]|uniref:vWA domain-containing protein n=1 Tax=uncultured Nostoc sp. TaxID=340711 RepID=UPI0035C9442E
MFPEDPKLYWIQRVKNNHPGLSVDHGEIEDTLDVSFDNIETPYFLNARSYGASDAPFRNDFVFSHFWDAELYLAQETREGDLRKVTIYNGVEWGWRNETFGREKADICKTPDISDCINNPPNTPIDLAFVFDTTGSMGGYLDGMKTAFKNLAQSLFEQVPGTRIAVVDYKDFPLPPFGQFGDYPYRADLAFSSDITSIDNAINQLTVGGGGDTPESLWSGLTRTINTENLNGWRDGVKKGVIYLTDAFAHDPEPFTGYTVSSIIDESFHVDPVRIYGIVPSYFANTELTTLTRLSEWTGGKLFIANSSDDIAKSLAEALTDINGSAITPTPNSDPETPTPKSVPETMPTYGLLALAVGSIIQKLKTNRLRSKNV